MTTGLVFLPNGAKFDFLSGLWAASDNDRCDPDPSSALSLSETSLSDE